MGETEIPAQSDGNESLPNAGIAPYFTNPFHARILVTWLRDPSLISPQDAVLPMLDAMTPAEILEFGKYIDADFIQTDRHDIDSLWPRGELRVDENGLVTAALGHINLVKDFFRNEHLCAPILDFLEEDLSSETYFAAERWRGEAYANELTQTLDEEREKRSVRKMTEERLLALPDAS